MSVPRTDKCHTRRSADNTRCDGSIVAPFPRFFAEESAFVLNLSFPMAQKNEECEAVRLVLITHLAPHRPTSRRTGNVRRIHDGKVRQLRHAQSRPNVLFRGFASQQRSRSGCLLQVPGGCPRSALLLDIRGRVPRGDDRTLASNSAAAGLTSELRKGRSDVGKRCRVVE